VNREPLTWVNAVEGTAIFNAAMTRAIASRLLLAWAFALAAVLCIWVLVARAQDGPEAATELEPVTVIAPIPPLDRSRHLLRLLVEKSAPCLGCDAAGTARDAQAELLQYLLASTPPEVDEATRLAFEVKLQDSPDLQYLRR
jgi:hypothetical protein